MKRSKVKSNTAASAPVKLSKESLKNNRFKPAGTEELNAELLQVKRKYYKIRRQYFTLRRIKLWPAMAIASMFIAGSGLLFLKDMQTVTHKETFNTYYSLFDERKTIDSGIKAYLAKDYKQAANALVKDSIFIDTRMMRAIANIEQGEYLTAIEQLKEINNHKAEWLQALCLIRIEDDTKARQLLEKIMNNSGRFSMQAEEILKAHYYGYNTRKKH